MTSKRTSTLPVVAIVGRANAGKSTLWNRLTDTNRALVSPIAHTTRDRNYAPCLWRGMAIEVVDTGGLDAEQGSEIGRGILKQAESAVREADLVLYLFDAEEGILPQDRDFARSVWKLNKNILLIANKIDMPRQEALATAQEVFGLGLGAGIPISAGTGRGIGDLLDLIFEALAKHGTPPEPIPSHATFRIVIMGRPNVGKSSLTNAILGEERVIVSPIPHTTREPQDTEFEWNGNPITLVDTAGMRKRSKIERGLEDQGIERNRDALLQADVAFLVFDATEDPTTQDRHLAGLLKDAGKGLVLVANKWDLVGDKSTETSMKYEELIRSLFPFLNWAPMVFISAAKRQRTDKLLDIAWTIRDERNRQIAYNALQRFLKTCVARHKPIPYLGTKAPYLHDMSQIGSNPPAFLVTVRGETTALHPSWLRYLEGQLRQKFGFKGTPITLISRAIPVPKPTYEEKKAAKAERAANPPKHPWARKRRAIGRKGGRY